MHNPVDWHPWGPETLERARREGRPLLVSIGYSACHWCHVMERESFEDPETAALMNRAFVNVKVDREERPDVDQLYMDTVVRLTGHGGWPLTVFCTPEGKPFYAGTYFPPEPRHGLPSFRELLLQVEKVWKERPDDVERSAHEILDALARRPQGTASQSPGAETAARAATRLLQAADLENGGFGGAPKFPAPPNLELLLAAASVLPERKAEEALEHVVRTCREMSRRGLYDHLGGGFHRYSVDARWAVPHFEKMLYDQGQLLRLYVEAWRRTGDADLLWPVHETVAWLRREMRAADGGFYASQDADSEGEEGRFYVWTPEQVEEVLGAERAAAFCRAYGVTARGNFEEGRTVLADRARRPREELAAERKALYRARQGRVAPGTDRKRVGSWNALVVSGLARAGSLLEDADMLRDAAETADFLLALRDDRGRLLRIFNEGRAHVTAFLDDVAALLEACLDLYRAGAGDRFLGAAAALAGDIASRFYDEREGDLFLTPVDAEPLAQRPRSDHDGATPHSTGLAVLGLLRTAELTGRSDWRHVAEQVLRSHALVLERAPEAFPTLARAALLAQRGGALALVVGDPDAADTTALAARARSRLAPDDAVLVVRPGDRPGHVDAAWLEGRGPVAGRAAAYVCRGVTCSLPVTDPDELDACLNPETSTTIERASTTT
jgi:uncharacterized protein YyaL (SSP411 family)